MPFFHLGHRYSGLVWTVLSGELVMHRLSCTWNYCSLSHIGQAEGSGSACQIWHSTFFFKGPTVFPWSLAPSPHLPLFIRHVCLYQTLTVIRFHALSHFWELQGNQACSQTTVLSITTYSVMGKEFPEHFRPKKEVYMLEHWSICCPNSAPASSICTVT